MRRHEDAPYQEGYLDYLTPSGLHGADPYRPVYSKTTNSSEDDWSDLISLTQTLAKGHKTTITATPTWDADYVPAVQATVNVDEWMRWFAVETLFANNETNIARGYGDDYYLYIGKTDPRAQLIPYDLDTILGKGDSPAATDVSIFRMVMHASSEIGQLPTPLLPFLRHPSFAPLYFAALKEQLDGPMSVQNFNALEDQILTGVVDAAHISALKTWYAARHAYVRSQIPLAISVTSAPAVDTASGYAKSTAATCNLAGRANAITTRSVKVSGLTATYNPFRITGTITTPDDDLLAVVGEWNITGVPLRPGINRILIQAFDAENVETEHYVQDIWFDDASVVNFTAGNLGTQTWTAAAGPYRIAGNNIVPAGVTLTIQAGTTVYIAPGATLVVNGTGKILATGTQNNHIVIAHEPGATGTTWGSLDFINTTVESSLSYVDFLNGGGTTVSGHNAQVHVNNAIVFFDHLFFPPAPTPTSTASVEDISVRCILFHCPKLLLFQLSPTHKQCGQRPA